MLESNSLRNFNHQKKILKIIIGCVVAFHVLFLCFLSSMDKWKPEPKKTKKMVVQTVRLNPHPTLTQPVIQKKSPQEALPAEVKPEPIQEAPQPKAEPEAKPPTPNPQPKKMAPPKPQSKVETKPQTKAVKPAPKKVDAPKPAQKKIEEPAKPTYDPQKQELLREKLAALQSSKDKLKSVSQESTAVLSTLPKQLERLNVDSLVIVEVGRTQSWGSKETNYREQVAAHLKKVLKLQDVGSIQIKISIDRSGKIVKHEILKSESKKNLSYIQSMLPSLSFPAFQDNLFEGAETYTLLVTLDNE